MADVNYDVIIAADTGKTAGVATLVIPRRELWIGYQEPRLTTLDMLSEWEMPTTWKVLLVAEKFIITPQTGKLSQQPDALKMNGALEWLCHRRGWDYEEQTAASAKKIAQDDRLQRLGLYVPTPGGHANDGTRHLILAIERKMPSLLDDETLIGYTGSITTVKRSKRS